MFQPTSVAEVYNAVRETITVYKKDSLVVLVDRVVLVALPAAITACRPGHGSNFLNSQIDRERQIQVTKNAEICGSNTMVRKLSKLKVVNLGRKQARNSYL